MVFFFLQKFFNAPETLPVLWTIVCGLPDRLLPGSCPGQDVQGSHTLEGLRFEVVVSCVVSVVRDVWTVPVRSSKVVVIS